jgi:glycine dehydrogenase
MPDPKRSLIELEMRGDFIHRHIGSDQQQITEMLEFLGLDSLEALVDRAVPASLLSDEPLDLPPPMSERGVLSYMRRMRERNKVFISLIGMGYYGTIMPAVIKRNVLENPGWYTAYTPLPG